MATLSLSNLGVGAGGTSSLGESGKGITGVQRAAFEEALSRKSADQAPAPTEVTATTTATPAPRDPSAAGYENSNLARERVRRSLELDATRSAGDGDTILKGLQKLRGTFEERHSRINEIMSSKTVDTNALLAMQMEVAQYSLLVDVSSKLTGKTTQSLDTLMKGQ